MPFHLASLYTIICIDFAPAFLLYHVHCLTDKSAQLATHPLLYRLAFPPASIQGPRYSIHLRPTYSLYTTPLPCSILLQPSSSFSGKATASIRDLSKPLEFPIQKAIMLFGRITYASARPCEAFARTLHAHYLRLRAVLVTLFLKRVLDANLFRVAELERCYSWKKR